MPPIITDAGRIRLASPRALARALVAPAITVLLLLAFRDKLLSVDFAETRAAFSRIAPAAWLQAAALAGLGYWALGRFDAIAHRMFHTGVGQKLARRAGMAAMAVSQTLGVGILTGALARWRLIPGLSPARALMLSTVMAAGFFVIWAWLSMAALMLHPELEPDTAAAARAGFWITSLLGAALAFWPNGLARKARRRLRSSGIGMRSIAAMTFYAVLDMLAAAGVMHVLLDGAAAVPLHVMVPVFLLSLGAGLMAGTPAGLGAFELTILSLLPTVDPALLVAAITGYRLVYFAIPAALATVALAAPALIRPKHGAIELEWRRGAEVGCANTELGRALAECSLAEAHLVRQPGLGLLWSASLAAAGSGRRRRGATLAGDGGNRPAAVALRSRGQAGLHREVILPFLFLRRSGIGQAAGPVLLRFPVSRTGAAVEQPVRRIPDLLPSLADPLALRRVQRRPVGQHHAALAE
ncbi:hypothetical protein [Mangrovicoccus ximenensis]|uniref:hypothetical protein n=1 Tax=Mangrovicoccus ximenensis TaxID=1911570 RepID=UPI000D3AA779|nr:hypothetical protein [Mangrovicoccus ximenensis]